MRGEAALDGAVVRTCRAWKASPRAVGYEHVRPDGHVLDVIHTVLPDGGE